MPANANAVGTIGELSVGHGTLLAKGVAISVPITYTCEGFAVTYSLQVRQRVSGGALAAGESYGWQPVVCDGTTRVATFIIQVDTNLGTTFKSGTAFATTAFTVCDEAFECSSMTQATEIRLAKN